MFKTASAHILELADQRDRDQVGVVVRCSRLGARAHLHGAIAPGKPCTAANRSQSQAMAVTLVRGRRRAHAAGASEASGRKAHHQVRHRQRGKANSNIFEHLRSTRSPKLKKWVRGRLCLLRLLSLREIALRVASYTYHDAYSPRPRLPAVQGLRGAMAPCTSAARALRLGWRATSPS